MLKSSKHFIRAFFLPIFLALPLGVTNFLFLQNVGELDSIEEVVSEQNLKGGLYGTALHKNVYPYKLALYQTTRPEVVVIGSSRVLQLREAFFNRPFSNLGRTINYPIEAEKLVDDMLKLNKPQLVLFGIDFWWGNPNTTEGLNFRSHTSYGGNLTPDGLIAPFKWLVEGKLGTQFYIDTVLNKPTISDSKYLGVQAHLSGYGFALDGSGYYLGDVYGRKSPASGFKFAETLGRVKLSSGQFKYGDKVSRIRVESLKRTIAKLHNAGVQVITFMPPVAPTVYEAMVQKGDSYKYVDLFREQVASLNKHHYDFHDAKLLNSSDCEFIDGFHGGDVIAARTLLSMANDKGNELSQWINTDYLNQVVELNNGHALFDHRFKKEAEMEIDFLGLGCQKNLVQIAH